MMEIVYTALVGGIFSLLGIYLIFSLQTRKMTLEQNYKIRRFKLGNKFKLKKSELPEDIKSPKDKLIDGLIKKYAPRLLGTDEDEDELETDDIVENIIQGALKGATSGKKEESETFER